MKIVYLLMLVLFSTTLFSQDYSTFYRCANSADSLSYHKNYQKALDTIEYGFKTVDYIPSPYLQKALFLAVKLKEDEKSYHYAKLSVINSGTKKFPSNFLKTKAYSAIKDSLDFFIATHNKRINHEYIALIDSIFFVDQNIVRNNKTVKGNYDIEKSELPENRFELDKSNWELLHQLIQTHGFPSEQNVGLKTYRKVWAILVHSLRLNENVSQHEEIFSYIKSGEYLPSDIFLWYEQYNQNELKQTFFSTWDGNTSPENLARIDANQRKFFLKGIYSFELKKGGRFMNQIW